MSFLKRKIHFKTLYTCTEDVQVAIGQVHGTLNGVMLPQMLLLANISKTRSGARHVSCSLSGMPPPIRNWLQFAVPLATPVYWAGSEEKSGTINGLTLTRGRFNFSTVMGFGSGQQLMVEHVGHGVNEKGVLVMDVKMEGKTPRFPSGSRVSIPDYKELFVQTGTQNTCIYLHLKVSISVTTSVGLASNRP